MYRNEAILMVHEITGKSIRESRHYLDRIIQLYTPEFDALKNTGSGQISGTKASHLKGIVNTYVADHRSL